MGNAVCKHQAALITAYNPLTQKRTCATPTCTVHVMLHSCTAYLKEQVCNNPEIRVQPQITSSGFPQQFLSLMPEVTD